MPDTVKNPNPFPEIDKKGMYEILRAFPEQFRWACEIGKIAPGFPKEIKSNHFLILGMGGSAIGGDLLNSYLSVLPGAEHIRITVNRGYALPKNIDKDINIIASSYSGNTEETLSAFEEARELTENILCISAGGELSRKAAEHKIPVIKIPIGLQPRAAIGYSFFPMLFALVKTNALKESAIESTEKALEELRPLLAEKSKEYSDANIESNLAYQIAKKIKGTIPVIYSSAQGLDSVNIRWRCQIQENAKNMAFGNLLPEMNHNEINSFSFPEGLAQKISMIFLTDPYDHPRVKVRFNALRSIIENNVKQVITLESDAKNLLARMFDIIYLGDWVSYYLAILNNVDPTEIPLITQLKNFLSEE